MDQQPSWLAKQQLQSSSKMRPPKTTGRVILKIALYFVGAVIAEFGLLGGVGTTTHGNGAFSCLGFSVGILALSGSIVIFFRKEYYLHCLSRIQYLWWILGVSCAFVTVFGMLFGFTNPNNNLIANTIAIGILMLYGISFMWIAHLKPPMAQQINENVYRILKTTPGNQIVVSDLLTRLQKTYKQGDPTTLHRYLDYLDYIEVTNIPGTSDLVCRIKWQKQVFKPPLKIPTPISSPHPQVAITSIPLTHHTPLIRGITSPAGQWDSPNNKKLQETKISLKDQKTIPALPIAMPNQITPLPLDQGVMPSPSLKPLDAPTPPLHQTAPPVPLEPHNSVSLSFQGKEQKAIRIFCCYTHEDEQLLDKLKTHLKPQERQGLIQIWYDRNILAGVQWEQEIEEQLNTAQVILLLVSPDFIASDYCYTKELQHVLERHKHGEVCAIPIILRPTDWKITPLGKLQALPKDGKPITTWENRDNAYLNVATGIRAIVANFLIPPQQSKKPIQTLSNSQKTEEESELIRTRCSQGKLIVTNKKIAIELTAFGKVIKSQILLRASLTSIDSKLIVPSVLGKGGGTNLTFHGKGRELLKAELVSPKKAQEILTLLS